MMRILISILFIFLTLPSAADDVAVAVPRDPYAGPMSFVKWKEAQVMKTKNRLARVSNSLLVLKSETIRFTENLPEGTEEPKTTEEDVRKKEQDVKIAKEAYQYAQELSIEDYFAVYLSQFKSDSEALSSVASKFSPDEVKLLVKTIFKLKESELDAIKGISPELQSALGKEKDEKNTGKKL